jgi:hypothetical protein
MANRASMTEDHAQFVRITRVPPFRKSPGPGLMWLVREMLDPALSSPDAIEFSYLFRKLRDDEHLKWDCC